DHFVAVLDADDTLIRFHDPHGHPYAALPTRYFLAAWWAASSTTSDGPRPGQPVTVRSVWDRVDQLSGALAQQ
ncbi:MAG TPA: hypothetical protein VFC00_23215, partial [Micromonosporaceae bacterium]|nr:hypothetical protein [Micromonosporaceae bacterium]